MSSLASVDNRSRRTKTLNSKPDGRRVNKNLLVTETTTVTPNVKWLWLYPPEGQSKDTKEKEEGMRYHSSPKLFAILVLKDNVFFSPNFFVFLEKVWPSAAF